MRKQIDQNDDDRGASDGEDIEAFAQRQRRAPYTRFLVLATAIGLGYLGYTQLGGRLAFMMGGEEGMGPDDPRVLLAPGGVVTTSTELSQVRWLLSDPLPTYLENLRRYRAAQAASGSVIDSSQLDGARDALFASVADDGQLSTILRGLIGLAEGDPASSSSAIQELIDSLNLLFQARQQPFLVRGEVLMASPASLQMRLYEQVGEDTFQVGSATRKVAYLDRLDTSSLVRESEQRTLEERDPTVLVRSVLTEANGTLLASLHQGGRWRLAHLTPGVPALRDAEDAIGAQVWTDWSEELKGSVPASALHAIEPFSAAVLERNMFLREINDRDPKRMSIFDPPAVAGHALKMWLERLHPYAVQGRTRLTVADLNRLRDWNSAVKPHLLAATPALQEVLRRQLRLAGVAELTRARLRPLQLEVLPALRGQLSPDDALLAGREVASQLTRVIEGAATCKTVMAELASRMIDGGPLDQLSAQLIYDALLPLPGAPSGIDGLPARLPVLQETSCSSLITLARTTFEQHFGPYEEITLVQGQLSLRGPGNATPAAGGAEAP